ncbi:peptidase S8 [Mycobacterium rhizamassiliense]|uniref:Peptidase S8 n=1 Tax=Mycobacterium rhizamassiliense TaxID=1841860 RepID=A0A2U3NZ17_9MYCO|nr:peptidase S8 [Mycobacterium rhizamassiliense]
MFMRRFGTGNGKAWRGRASRATVAALLLTTGSLAGLPPASAIVPPTIDPGAIPPDTPPGPPAPMKQNSYCTEVGVLPGTNFKLQPKYMDMLNLQEAWQFGRGAGQKVAVIDTGVSPHPRFQHLIPGGDYVMGGDGLSDCDAHGTIVASMIGAASAGGAAAPPVAAPRKPVTIPTTEPPPKAPPPQTVTLSPLPQTVTMVPPTETPPPGPFAPTGADTHAGAAAPTSAAAGTPGAARTGGRRL